MAVLSLIIGLVFGSLIQSLLKDAGLDTSGLTQNSSWIAEDNDPDRGIADENNPLSVLGELGDLLEGLEGMAGQENFSGN